MEKFMLLFRSTQDYEGTFQEYSPEQIQAELEKWNGWIGGIAAQGKLVATDALLPTGRTLSGPQHVVTEGPFVESKEIVGGYLLLEAASLDEASELAKGCPIFEVNGRVEVRPVQVFG